MSWLEEVERPVGEAAVGSWADLFDVSAKQVVEIGVPIPPFEEGMMLTRESTLVVVWFAGAAGSVVEVRAHVGSCPLAWVVLCA